MNVTLHLNWVLICGVCMLPGAFVVFYLIGMIAGALGLELAAFFAALWIAGAVFFTGLVLAVFGAGMAFG